MAHKLLLADDSVTIQRVIELTFAGEDVQVLTAGDGEQAIQRVQEERPDIVLADIGMPKRSGYEVAAFIKADPELSHIPVLLLTGAFEPVDDYRARAVGCDGVLMKPFEPQQVIARVRELLEAGKGRAGLHAVPEVPRTLDRLAPHRAVEMPARYEASPAAPSGDDNPSGDFDFGGPSGKPRGAGGESALDDYFDRLDAAFANISTQGGSQAPPEPEPVHEPEVVPRHEGVVKDKELDWFDSPAPTPQPIDLTARHMTPDPAPAPSLSAEPPEAQTTFANPPSALEWPVPGVVDGLTAGVHHPEPPPPEPADASPTISGQNPQMVSARDPDVPSTHTVPHVSVAEPMPILSTQRTAIADAFSALLAVEQGEPGALPVRLTTAPVAPQVTDQLIEEITRRVIERLAPDAVRQVVSEVVTEVAERLVRDEIQRLRSRR